MASIKASKGGPPRSSTFRWFLGMILASVFSMSYFVAPFYMITALLAIIFNFPCRHAAWVYASPILISAVIPSIPSPWAIRMLAPMLDYFDYEEIHETKPVDVAKEILNGTNYLCVFQPHGVLSYAGICSVIGASSEYQGKLKTAVADALLYTPILKHVMGIFGLISATKESMKKTLRQPGVSGTIVLYVGGMAELFLSSETEERIYLNKRKGFIKLALTEGVDIVPVYLFGNTSTLSVLKTGFLAALSRSLQVSLTYVWGKFYLPIPRDCKVSVLNVCLWPWCCRLTRFAPINCLTYNLSFVCSFYMSVGNLLECPTFQSRRTKR
jgi:hypothetical protein